MFLQNAISLVYTLECFFPSLASIITLNSHQLLTSNLIFNKTLNPI